MNDEIKLSGLITKEINKGLSKVSIPPEARDMVFIKALRRATERIEWEEKLYQKRK